MRRVEAGNRFFLFYKFQTLPLNFRNIFIKKIIKKLKSLK